MIKRVLTFVPGVHESVLVDFLSRNKVKIVFIKNFLTKTNSYFYEFLNSY